MTPALAIEFLDRFGARVLSETAVVRCVVKSADHAAIGDVSLGSWLASCHAVARCDVAVWLLIEASFVAALLFASPSSLIACFVFHCLAVFAITDTGECARRAGRVRPAEPAGGAGIGRAPLVPGRPRM